MFSGEIPPDVKTAIGVHLIREPLDKENWLQLLAAVQEASALGSSSSGSSPLVVV